MRSFLTVCGLVLPEEKRAVNGEQPNRERKGAHDRDEILAWDAESDTWQP
jgi:hypothetical protein